MEFTFASHRFEHTKKKTYQQIANGHPQIADIYISISTGTFDIENIKYEKKWQQLDLDTNFEP